MANEQAPGAPDEPTAGAMTAGATSRNSSTDGGTKADPSAAGGADVDWLDDEEMAAWRSMIEVHTAVMASLEAESVERHGLSGGDYAVLVNLSEAPDLRVRMCDLASALHLSPSGITRRLDGLVRQGLVAREPSTEDRRVMLAVLTPAGRDALEAAAPDHVDAVRRHFLDHLSRTQIRNLAAAFAAVERGRERQAATARGEDADAGPAETAA